MKKTFNLTYACGLHARPSTHLAKLVKEFDAKVIVERQGRKAHADSIIEVLSLGVQAGEVTFETEGNDAEKAMSAIENFIKTLNENNHW